MRKSAILLTSALTAVSMIAAPVNPQAGLATKAKAKVSLSELKNKRVKPAKASAERNNLPRARKAADNGMRLQMTNVTPTRKHMKRAPLRTSDVQANIAGAIIYNDASSGTAEYGIYTFTPQSTTLTQKWTGDIGSVTFYANGKVYAVVQQTFWGMVYAQGLYSYDYETGVADGDPVSMGLDYTPSAATYYSKIGAAVASGYWADGDDTVIGLMQLDLDGGISKLMTTDVSFSGGLAEGANGDLFGVTGDGDLYKIDLAANGISKIGSTGLSTDYVTALGYDKANNVLFWADCPDSGGTSLYTIDPATGAAELCETFENNLEFSMLHVEAAPAAPGAPAAPSDLSVTFADGALNGNVTFLPPTETVDGEVGSGDITYFVTINGTEVATGTTTFGGDAVSVSANVAKGGWYDVAVYCSNAAGEGKSVTSHLYLGPDTPLPVENVVLAYASDKFTLTWDAVKGSHDGFVNQANVKYTVTRYVDKEATVVSTDQSATSFEEDYAEPTTGLESIYYTVSASYEGNVSDPVSSNTVNLGKLLPPYTNNFETAADADYLTIIDNNADESTWSYYESYKCMRCAYDSSNDADDYLVLPGLTLEKGKLYLISFIAGNYSNSWPEKVALYAGKEATAAALTEEIVAPTELSEVFSRDADGNAVGEKITGNYVAQDDGVVYFAIKGCSDADQFYLCVTDINVSAGMSAQAPKAVSGLTVTPDATGANKATVAFTAPSENIAGEALSALTKIEVSRDGEVIKTFDSPAVGEALTFDDEDAPNGNVTYTVIAYNDEGAGLEATATCFVGFEVPADLTGVTAATGADYGEVVLNWDAVEFDLNGLALPEVTYAVYELGSSSRELIAENITETTYTVRACAADAEQEFKQYAVFPVDAAGEGAGGYTDLVCVGAPYEMPFYESGALNHIVGISQEGYGSWQLADDSSVSGVSSQDADNAMFALAGYYSNDGGKLFTGKIHIDENAANPIFGFYYWGMGSEDENTVQAIINAGEGWALAGEQVVLGTGTESEWNRVVIDLSEYKGKDIQVGIEAYIMTYGTSLFDNFAVEDQKEKDLAASLSVAPAVNAGESLPITVNVSNLGSANAEGATVDIYVNGKVAMSEEVPAIEANKKTAVVVEYNVSEVAPDKLEIYAVVNYGGDENPDNNTTDTATVNVRFSNVPAPAELKGEVGEDGKLNLTWEKPDTENFDPTVTESFEDCDAFATMNTGSTNGWKFVDKDGEGVGGFSGITLPNITSQQPASWFVLDQTNEQLNASFAGHTGDKSLAALYNATGAQNDDWAISPELSGSAQTISFYARAYSADYPETMEVLYSTTDTDPDSFISVKEISGITTDGNRSWTEYTADLPDGAKYFALRYRSADCFMLMVDDVTYAPAGATSLELAGYNVFRNGVKINSDLVQGESYTDEEASDGDVYVVVAVYASGETSAPSNEYTADLSGILDLTMGRVVKGMKGQIEIRGIEGKVVVSDMSGKVVYTGDARTISADAGVYTVVAGRKTYKVMVK